MKVVNNEEMQQNEVLSKLNAPCPSVLGKLLLASQFVEQGKNLKIPVKLYQKCVQINNQRYILIDFDVKFRVIDNTITFDSNSQQITYTFPNSDQQQWRNKLSKYLNQRGFNEDFKPIKKIGKGNFASVYLAQKKGNKSKCAVKAFSKQAAYSQENGKQCLIKEIQIMRHLHHKNVMELLEVYESDNSLYIVFQLLEGGQLYDRIKTKQKFKPHQVRTMVLSLLKGLNEMHSKNIMHRDLKPQNILFRTKYDDECVIADFGLAQFADAEKFLFVRCGTPGYVAPQVINIKDMSTKYSPICDIFSLGLIFHVLLFGKSVFNGTKYNEILAANRASNFNFQSEIYNLLSPECLDLLKKMLKKNPQERITAEQALEHPYFKNFDEKEEIELEETISKKISRISLTRINKSDIQKDSLLSFKMNKQNAFNGNVDTVKGNTLTTSFGGDALGISNKLSQFTKNP